MRTRRIQDLLALLPICLCINVHARGYDRPQNLYFVPVGDAPKSEISDLVTHYRERFGIQIRVLPPIAPSTGDLDQARHQLIAESVIETMLRSYPEYASDESSVLIGITRQDIYPRSAAWRFCFGWRMPQYRSAIVSTARMNLEDSDEPSVEATLEKRLRKTVTKDIGILLYGMSSNNNPRSVLYNGILGVQELDSATEEFAPKPQISLPLIVPVSLLALLVAFLSYWVLQSRTDKEDRAIGSLCPKCGRNSNAGICLVCGNRVLDSAEAKAVVNKSLLLYPLPTVVGLFGILIAVRLYPPLDMNPVMGVSVIVFFIPGLAHIAFGVRRQLSSNVELLKRMYVAVAVLLAVFAGSLFLNGSLDKYPSVQAQSHVTRKYVTRGRGGSSYSLYVSPSWRPGRREERLEVSGKTFSTVEMGEPVLVVVHPGVFQLPWFSNVLPE